ncbi:MAG TPA: amidase [Chloroflexaceae bacterium]|nr:amidase [Chloroflexaceae bacterium]
MTDRTERLRANLAAAGIPATEEDLAGIAAKGFLSRLADFERLVAGVDPAALPDYLDAASLPAPPDAPAIPAEAAPPVEAPPGSILDAAARLRAREVSPVDLAEAALARIAALDPRLNAFQLVAAEAALSDAREAERELAAGRDRGPLHGLPVAVKDLFDMAGLPAAAGSKIRAGAIADEDATVVARLRAAGAVIVGRTRMSEFAYSPGSNNAHYGPTANPYDQTRDTGGSSSGSAAAVAAGMAVAALGTDTGCSIRIPAAFCGLVGLKPTWGRVSLAGGVTLSWSLDHAGPLTRCVADAAVMLAVLAGPDPRDGRTLRHAPPFEAADLTTGVAGLRVGLLRSDGGGAAMAGPEQLGAARRAAEALAAAGAEVVELDMPELDALRVTGGAILAMEAAAYHLPWLRGRLDDYGEFMRQRVLAAFAYEAGAFVRAQQARAGLRLAAARVFERADVLLGPIHPGPVPALGVPANNGLAIPFNCLGWPALTQPAGLGADGLPLSVQLAAAPWDEATLLRAAYAVERGLGLVSPGL